VQALVYQSEAVKQTDVTRKRHADPNHYQAAKDRPAYG
jgi:hypothetical protein